MPFDQIWNEVPLKVIDKEGEKRLTEKYEFCLFIEIQQWAELKIIKEMAFKLGNEDFFPNFGNFW